MQEVPGSNPGLAHLFAYSQKHFRLFECISFLKFLKFEDLEEVWADIMRAIDEIVHTVKPKKLLMLALDGVAPRAKMNQQRARRFRTAKDS